MGNKQTLTGREIGEIIALLCIVMVESVTEDLTERLQECGKLTNTKPELVADAVRYYQKFLRGRRTAERMQIEQN